MIRARLMAAGFLFDSFARSGVIYGAEKIKQVLIAITATFSREGQPVPDTGRELFGTGKYAWKPVCLSGRTAAMACDAGFIEKPRIKLRKNHADRDGHDHTEDGISSCGSCRMPL